MAPAIDTETASRLAALALRARLSAALGYPRAPTAADRVGGGAHTPFAEAVTRHAVAIELHPTDRERALVVLRNVPINRLNNDEKTAALDARPAEFDRTEPLP